MDLVVGDPAGVERLLDRAVLRVEQEAEQDVVGLERLRPHARRLLAGAPHGAAGAAGDHELPLGLAAAASVAGVGGLARDAQRVGDPLPRPAGADRLIDVRRLQRVEPAAKLGDRREAGVGIAAARGDAEQLRLAVGTSAHAAAEGTRRHSRRQ